jgi:hypothetical protein
MGCREGLALLVCAHDGLGEFSGVQRRDANTERYVTGRLRQAAHNPHGPHNPQRKRGTPSPTFSLSAKPLSSFCPSGSGAMYDEYYQMLLDLAGEGWNKARPGALAARLG